MKTEHSLHLQMGTCSVEITSEHQEICLALGHIYRAFATETLPPLPRGLDKLADGEWRASVGERAFEFEHFAEAIEVLGDFIAERLMDNGTGALVLHAGAVHNEDHIVFLVGKSGSGKTTSSLELVQRGMRFLTDEFVIINGDMLQPFPRCATQKFVSRTPPGQDLRMPDIWGHREHVLPNLRASLQPITMPPRCIIFPTHKPDCTPSVRGMGPAEICGSLMHSTFNIRGRVEDLWPSLSDFALGAKACALEYREAAQDLDLALDFLGVQL